MLGKVSGGSYINDSGEANGAQKFIFGNRLYVNKISNLYLPIHLVFSEMMVKEDKASISVNYHR